MPSPSSSVAKQMLDASLSSLMVEMLEYLAIALSYPNYFGALTLYGYYWHIINSSISIIVLNVNMINMVTLGQLLLLN